MLTVFGSTALDTIRTPKKTLKNILGGAATFAAISASNFVNTGLIAVVGKDFPKQYHNILSKYLDLQGLTIKNGKTFRYDGRYDNTLSTRSTLKTELNVLLHVLLQYTMQKLFLQNLLDIYPNSSCLIDLFEV